MTSIDSIDIALVLRRADADYARQYHEDRSTPDRLEALERAVRQQLGLPGSAPPLAPADTTASAPAPAKTDHRHRYDTTTRRCACGKTNPRTTSCRTGRGRRGAAVAKQGR